MPKEDFHRLIPAEIITFIVTTQERFSPQDNTDMRCWSLVFPGPPSLDQVSPTLGLLTFWVDKSLLWRWRMFSCTFYDIQQHPWPLPSRWQEKPYSPVVVTVDNVSRYCPLSLYGAKPTLVENHCSRPIMGSKVQLTSIVLYDSVIAAIIKA